MRWQKLQQYVPETERKHSKNKINSSKVSKFIVLFVGYSCFWRDSLFKWAFAAWGKVWESSYCYVTVLRVAVYIPVTYSRAVKRRGISWLGLPSVVLDYWCRTKGKVLILGTCGCNERQFDSIQSNSIQFNPIQFNSIRFNSIQFNPIQSNPVLKVDIGGLCPDGHFGCIIV
jgi:hypothetical protein